MIDVILLTGDDDSRSDVGRGAAPKDKVIIAGGAVNIQLVIAARAAAVGDGDARLGVTGEINQIIFVIGVLRVVLVVESHRTSPGRQIRIERCANLYLVIPVSKHEQIVAFAATDEGNFEVVV